MAMHSRAECTVVPPTHCRRGTALHATTLHAPPQLTPPFNSSAAQWCQTVDSRYWCQCASPDQTRPGQTRPLLRAARKGRRSRVGACVCLTPQVPRIRAPAGVELLVAVHRPSTAAAPATLALRVSRHRWRVEAASHQTDRRFTHMRARVNKQGVLAAC